MLILEGHDFGRQVFTAASKLAPAWAMRGGHDVAPAGLGSLAFVTPLGWTTLPHEADPLGRLGPDSHRCKLAASAQFRHDLVRDLEKTAAKKFRYDAEADATEVSWLPNGRRC